MGVPLALPGPREYTRAKMRGLYAGFLVGLGLVAACGAGEADREDPSGKVHAAVLADGEATRVRGQPGFATSVANLAGRSASSLAGPSGVTVDGAGRVFVADRANHRVVTYSPGSKVADGVYGQADLVSATRNAGGLSASSLDSPADVAWFGSAAASDAGADAGAPAGGLYVSDSGNHRVLRFAGSSTTATEVWGQSDLSSNTPGTVPSATTLYQPLGVALDAAGNLYVADSLAHRVLRFPVGTTTADRVYGQRGSFTTRDPNKGGLDADTLKSPSGVAVDGSAVYVADTGNWRVLRYAGASTTATRVYGQDGSYTTAFPNAGGVSAQSLNAPSRLTFAGALWVADTLNHRVLRFEGSSTTANLVLGQNGAFTTSAANPGGVGPKTLRNPEGLAFDAAGTLHVADSLNHRALELAASCALSGCDDGNDCTDDVCQGDGTCARTPATGAPASCAGFTCSDTTLACRTTCTAGSECAPTHQCIQGHCTRACAGDADCGGPKCIDGWCCKDACDGACKSCAVPNSEGSCTNVPAGSDLRGACRGLACSGGGSCLLACSDATQCAQGFDCHEGVCTAPCATTDDCNGGNCVDGACCGVTQCDPGFTCNFDAASAGVCTKANGTGCADASECPSGHCVDGVCCESACDGVCVACNLPGTRGVCTPTAAGSDPADECPSSEPVCGGQCDGQGGCTGPAPAGTQCSFARCQDGVQWTASSCDGTGAPCPAGAATPCPDAFGCTADGTACRTSCTTVTHCAPGANCVSGKCEIQVATSCTSGSQCPTGHCVDGFCCNIACDGVCESCGITTRQGICTPIPAKTDPDLECSSGDVCVGWCNGASACEPAPQGTLCRAGTCLSREVAQPSTSCTGGGVPCAQPFADECGPGVCGGGECKSECLLDDDCAVSARCTKGKCTYPTPDAGCGCRALGAKPTAGSWLVVALGAAMLLRRRRGAASKKA